ncbi:MAG: general secretion pathway protein G [Planctomycetota bacterium]|jgi:general secretion pathway protein G
MKRPSVQGFTLIEVVIVIAIMTLMIGIAAPSISGLLNSEKDGATRDEVESLAAAVLTFTEDTYGLPATLGDLHSSTVSGFGGPYIDDSLGGRDVQGEGFRNDSWGRGYRYILNGRTQVEIASAGLDGNFGTSDDIIREIDVTPILRRLSLKNLNILNQAVAAYNQTNLKDRPLPQTTTTAVSRLVSDGYLPRGENFTRDAFGDSWVATSSPVVQFRSTNFGTSSPPSSGSSPSSNQRPSSRSPQVPPSSNRRSSGGSPSRSPKRGRKR